MYLILETAIWKNKQIIGGGKPVREYTFVAALVNLSPTAFGRRCNMEKIDEPTVTLNK